MSGKTKSVKAAGKKAPQNLQPAQTQEPVTDTQGPEAQEPVNIAEQSSPNAPLPDNSTPEPASTPEPVKDQATPQTQEPEPDQPNEPEQPIEPELQEPITMESLHTELETFKRLVIQQAG